ncbi:hypothetical protein G6F51_014554 [Rhizopus arrhizus]|uniref:Uncharacterized protein n=1 Tax=Rhizopus oryzae TaxID=64495 RepID=A0A9P7BYZ9_RHIOR|nr:hypothetical protein G6F51_014554 [Rhizopus arrhizus]
MAVPAVSAGAPRSVMAKTAMVAWPRSASSPMSAATRSGRRARAASTMPTPVPAAAWCGWAGTPSPPARSPTRSR